MNRLLALLLGVQLMVACAEGVAPGRVESDRHQTSASGSSRSDETSCEGPKAHPDVKRTDIPEVRQAIRRFIAKKRNRDLLKVGNVRLIELIYAIHPLGKPDEIATVFRLAERQSAKRILVGLPLRYRDTNLRARDPIGLIPPRFGTLGEGLVDLRQSLFLGYVFEYGQSYSPKVRRVKIVEEGPRGRQHVDVAQVCDGAFLIINKERSADSIVVIVKGRRGRILDRAWVDLRVSY